MVKRIKTACGRRESQECCVIHSECCYLLLSTENGNRRAPKSARGTPNLCIVAQVLHTQLFSCIVQHHCESCTLSLNMSTSDHSVLPSYSLLTTFCVFASLLFTYLGAKKGANILVVTSSWSCTSCCS